MVFNDLQVQRPVQADRTRIVAAPELYEQITAPAFGQWSGRRAQMLVHGYVRANGDGKLTVGCYLYDVALQEELVRAGWVVAAGRLAPRGAQVRRPRLLAPVGRKPVLRQPASPISPRRGPRIAASSGSRSWIRTAPTHRFITTGKATALTPRYSPDYKQIVYLSYLDGNPRIFVYDIGTRPPDAHHQSTNPTFAPRWSPDGKSILYSMAIAGNTDIYRVSATAARARKLTDSPGHRHRRPPSRPTARQIVFESDRSGSQQIYVMNADGGEPAADQLLRRALRDARMEPARRSASPSPTLPETCASA